MTLNDDVALSPWAGRTVVALIATDCTKRARDWAVALQQDGVETHIAFNGEQLTTLCLRLGPDAVAVLDPLDFDLDQGVMLSMNLTRPTVLVADPEDRPRDGVAYVPPGRPVEALRAAVAHMAAVGSTVA